MHEWRQREDLHPESNALPDVALLKAEKWVYAAILVVLKCALSDMRSFGCKGMVETRIS